MDEHTNGALKAQHRLRTEVSADAARTKGGVGDIVEEMKITP